MNQLFETSDGSHSLMSNQFNVSYHSKYGAIQETNHVFINAGLRLKAVVQSDISILGIGFGTGLNAYMTFLEAKKRNLNIKYTAVEAYPITPEMVNELNYAEIADEGKSDDIFKSMHHLPWSQPHQLTPYFEFEKIKDKFENLNFQNAFDVIYFDAFAPTAQPELWGTEVMTIMYNALKPEGVLTTYCAKGVVKRTMKAVGFTIEALQGPPGKREMTRAVKV